jgi:hypothetical protein
MKNVDSQNEQTDLIGPVCPAFGVRARGLELFLFFSLKGRMSSGFHIFQQ